MPYPTKYERLYDYHGYQVSNPTRPLPGTKIDADYNYVEQSIDEIVDFIKLFARSDGEIANEAIGYDQLALDVRLLLGDIQTLPDNLVALNELTGQGIVRRTTDGTFNTGVTVSVAEGGTGATTASAARASLGLAINTDVQAYSANLAAFSSKTAPTGDVVGTTDVQTLTNKSLTSPTITSPTGIVKGDVGLGNVDNTSDATKNAAVATLTNKSINAASNTISNLATSMFAANVVDTDGTMAANSDTRLASQKATKTYVDQIIAAQDAMVFKGVIDCSANPNYPAADRGWTYRVSVAGKIGGASGTNVEVGDLLLCLTDSTASGNQATVGSSWSIAQTNLDGAVIGPASAVSGNIPTFSGTTGKVIQDGGKALPTGNIVGTSDTQTLTGKSIDASQLTGSVAAARMPALTGDVTTSAGAVATTIANDAVTYAKMQNISATARILGRKTAAAGDAEECTLSEVLDFIGSAAQGDILYRGASGWARLGAGTSGNFLKTLGAGANPAWDSIPGGGDMLAANNLSDLVSKPTARGNLGVGNPGMHNRLINPSGEIWQRANSGAAAITDVTYAFDRWYGLTQSNGVTASQVTNAENTTPYMMRLTQANASAQRFGIAQHIESSNCINLRGQAVVLSARVRMSASTTLRYAIIEWTGTADSPTKDVVNDWNNGTFTTGNFFISTTTTITATGSTALTANTFTSISLTGTIGSSANNIAVIFWTESAQAQNVTLDIGKVQLEQGLQATPLAFRSYQEELELCLRYYFQQWLEGTGFKLTGDTNGTFRVPLNWPKTMRASPTVAVTTGTSSGAVRSDDAQQLIGTTLNSSTVNRYGPNDVDFSNRGGVVGFGYGSGTGSTAGRPVLVSVLLEGNSEI